MAIHSLSPLSPAAVGSRQDRQDSGESGNGAGGWKYLTVRANGKVYTYIVIGKNMKILVGEATEKKKEDPEETAADDHCDETEKTAATASGAAGPLALAAEDRKDKPLPNSRPDFFLDTRMFALTGYYQKKMRQTIKQLGDSLSADRSAAVISKTADKERAD
ncbi:MAG: hypothetical protein E6X17_13630 [Sporomusaceae bacterium]|nr:hypothetical protein [Sporomusaceae bacterium]